MWGTRMQPFVFVMINIIHTTNGIVKKDSSKSTKKEVLA
jgi:hypothetical protein